MLLPLQWSEPTGVFIGGAVKVELTPMVATIGGQAPLCGGRLSIGTNTHFKVWDSPVLVGCKRILITKIIYILDGFCQYHFLANVFKENIWFKI